MQRKDRKERRRSSLSRSDIHLRYVTSQKCLLGFTRPNFSASRRPSTTSYAGLSVVVTQNRVSCICLVLLPKHQVKSTYPSTPSPRWLARTHSIFSLVCTGTSSTCSIGRDMMLSVVFGSHERTATSQVSKLPFVREQISIWAG